METVRRAAHSLRSAASSLGGAELARLAGELETIIRDGDIENALDRVPALQRARQRYRTALDAERTRGGWAAPG